GDDHRADHQACRQRHGRCVGADHDGIGYRHAEAVGRRRDDQLMGTDVMNAWTRSPWTDAGQIVAFIDPDGLPGESAGRPPSEWYRRLIAANDMSGAIEFLALALPRYDCIVWVAQALLETGAVDRHDAMMTTVLRWIDNPQDDLRRRAQAEAIAERRTNAAKLLALAIAYSGGSVAPPDLPPVNVPPESC